MGDYSKISKNEVKDILKLYHLQGVKEITPQSQGITNSNYLIELEDKSKYILKVSNDKSQDQLLGELKILQYLHQQNYPYVVLPLRPYEQTKNRSFQWQHYFGALYPYQEGSVPQINQGTCQQIGSALGQLHNLQHDDQYFCSLREHSQVGFTSELIKDFRQDSQCPPFFAQYYDELLSERLPDFLKQNFEIGLIHGDLYFDNTLFQNNKIICVLDYEQSGVGRLALDLGISISGTCLEDGFLSPQLIRQFLIGYENFHPLSDHLKHWLNFSIIVGLFSISLWRIKRFTLGKLNPSMQESYKELLVRAKHFEALCSN